MEYTTLFVKLIKSREDGNPSSPLLIFTIYRHGMSWSDAAKETLRECGEKIGLKRYMDQLRSETQATEGTERIGERFQTEGAMQQPGIEREEERREPITQ